MNTTPPPERVVELPGGAPPRPPRWRAWLAGLWAGLWAGPLPAVGLAAEAPPGITATEARSGGRATLARAPVTAAEAEAVGAFAAAWYRGEKPSAAALPEAFMRQRGIVLVIARARGERVGGWWRQEPTGAEALRSALDALRQDLDPAERERITTLEINLAHSFAPVDARTDRDRLAHVYRGLMGIELAREGTAFRLAPTEMIAQNLSFERAIERLAERARVPAPLADDPSVLLRLFAADQLLIELDGPSARTTLMYRGNTVVPIETITKAKAEALAAAQTQWLFTNLQPDGRQVYLYWPSRGEESTANNSIRQWLATVAMGRAARARGDVAWSERVEQNIRYNLAHSYAEDDAGHGQIVEAGTTVKLGALAVAGLALVEHPARNAFAAQEAALRRTIDALWQPSGEFRTFWRPAERRDNVNFYPGEALLLWATLYAESRDPALLERILASQRFYRVWHLAHRNPAFVPWHTQAYFKVWQATRSDELRDWIFIMNDWLLDVQQWESQRKFPDTMGRFYDPDRPFGPPHASSTGVYLEGLIDAWRLAQATGDAERQERYRRAVVRGLRSLAQLTFLDEVDLFYISQRDRVRGGVRTTVYDNAIRVDNVQHSLMALLKILQHLPAPDFRP